MKRRSFLGLVSGGVMMAGAGYSIKNLLDQKNSVAKMPVLFLGHGSPMNAIAENDFTKTLGRLGKEMVRPKAILCISAHWMTNGTWVTHMDIPKTIHDFGGFPQALFDIQYPAVGKRELAEDIKQNIVNPQIQLNHDWGLDHGSWSVLRHLYPEADIPVLQLSLNMAAPLAYHFQLGQELRKWREKGVLILSSGNIVHNLRRLSWDEKARPYEWALEFDDWVKQKLVKRDFKSLQDHFLHNEAGKLSVPTLDHYLPLLYTVGASDSTDEMRFEYEEMQNASISMRSVSFGLA